MKMLPKLLVLLYLSTYYYKGFFLKKGKIFYLRKARFVIMSSAVHFSYKYEKEFCFAFQHYSPTVAAAYFSFFNLLCQVALHHHSPFLMLQNYFVPCAHFLFPTWQVLYSDSFRKQVQGKAAYVLDTPEMRRVRETQKHISTVRAFMGVLNWQ